MLRNAVLQEGKRMEGNEEVVVQWDRNYLPNGNQMKRKAIQIGIRGKIAQRYADGKWLLDVKDVSKIVHKLRNEINKNEKNKNGKWLNNLQVPKERVLEITDQSVVEKLQITTNNTST